MLNALTGVPDRRVAITRAKRAVTCLLWMGGVHIADIERLITRHLPTHDAAGRARNVASRTHDVIASVILAYVEILRLVRCSPPGAGAAVLGGAGCPDRLRGDEIALSDQRRVREYLRAHPLPQRVPSLYWAATSPLGFGVRMVVGGLPVPDLPARIPRIAQDSRDGTQCPRLPGPVRVALPVDVRGTRHPSLVECPGATGYAAPRQAPRVDRPQVPRGRRSGL